MPLDSADPPQTVTAAPVVALLQVLFGLVEFIVVCTALSQGLQAAAERKDTQATSRNSLTYRDIMVTVACLQLKAIACKLYSTCPASAGQLFSCLLLPV
jgi:hypothetical protein